MPPFCIDNNTPLSLHTNNRAEERYIDLVYEEKTVSVPSAAYLMFLRGVHNNNALIVHQALSQLETRFHTVVLNAEIPRHLLQALDNSGVE